MVSLAQGAVSGPHTRQANDTISSSAGPSSARRCPASQANESTNHSGSTFYSPSGGQIVESSTGDSSQLDGSLSSEGESRATPTVSVDDPKKISKQRKLACPFRKHDEVHGRHPTCGHQGSSSMSGLKGHLQSNTHNRDLEFIILCRSCAHYIVDISEWQTLHLTGLCIRHLGRSTKQVRGEGAVKQWQDLYMKRFPRSQRIPHPCMYIS